VFHFDWPENHPLPCGQVARQEDVGSGGGDEVDDQTKSEPTSAFALEQLTRSLMHGLRSGLPATIVVTQVKPVSRSFHARQSCTKKRYVYTIQEGRASPFEQHFRWQPTLGKSDVQLDLAAMQGAAALLVGEQINFAAFGRRDGPNDERQVVKSMESLVVERIPGAAGGGQNGRWGSVVTVTATCNRFLWMMMRRIAGTLMEVGAGRMSLGDFEQLLQNVDATDWCVGGDRERMRAQLPQHVHAYTAPPQGLCLDQVFYEDVESKD